MDMYQFGVKLDLFENLGENFRPGIEDIWKYYIVSEKIAKLRGLIYLVELSLLPR